MDKYIEEGEKNERTLSGRKKKNYKGEEAIEGKKGSWLEQIPIRQIMRGRAGTTMLETKPL